MTGHSLPEALEMGSASAAMLVASQDALEAFIREEKEQYGTMVSRI